MKFYNRKEELKELERVWKLCNKSTHFTLISGRRRIGKTELVKQFCKGKEHLYFFIGRKNTSLLLEELSSIAKTKINGFPTFIKFDEFLEFLLNHISKNTIIFFDEFQNFKYVDKSIFSDFQKIFDKYKNKLNIHIIVAGSQVSLINKTFSDNREPLFGRTTEKYILKPLSFSIICKILDDLKIKDLEEKIKWYSIFGGIPKYYVMAEEQGIKGEDIFSALNILLLRDFAPLKDEAKTVLIEEFGKEHSSYFSILEAVALGNSEMTTIANKSGINIKSISKYLSLLVKDFEYLSYEIPVTEKKHWKSKKGRYFIGDNFFRFWFKYLYRNRSEYEIGNYTDLLNKIKQDFNCFLGKGFEKICKEFLIENKEKLPFQFQKIGRQWGNYREDNKRKEYEIDLVALNEETKEIGFFEVKWKNLKEKQAVKILEDLKEKSKFVEWNLNNRQEFFGVIAKKIENKSKLRKQGFLVYDLKDF